MLFGTVAIISLAAMQLPQTGTSRRAEDPDRTVCRASQAVTGSRTAQRRVCKTVAEWRAYEQDRERLRREMMNTPGPPNKV